MLDADTANNLERIGVALEGIAASLRRLADKFAPVEIPREKRPAILSTATYSREERERQELRETLKKGTVSHPEATDL